MPGRTPMKDRLISTAVTSERRAELRHQIDEQRKLRSDDDPFFRHADWLLSEWEQAEREAAREYVPTTDAARLTGWSEQTLRKWGAAARDGDPLPEEWQELRARCEGGQWSFCVSTIPVKSTQAA